MEETVLVKLGGSVITYKGASPPRVNTDVVVRIATEIKAHQGPLLIVLGGGAHGHQAAHRFGFGVSTTPIEELMQGVPFIRHNMNLLASEVELILSDAGNQVVVIPPFTHVIMDNGKVIDYPLKIIKLALKAGYTVLTHGDVCFDKSRGASILSGDTIMVLLAKELGASSVFIGTNVDGVLSEDPQINPDAHHIPLIDKSNRDQILQAAGPSSHIDVTGGMARKLQELLELASSHVSITIFNLMVDGRLEALLEGRNVPCTRILD